MIATVCDSNDNNMVVMEKIQAEIPLMVFFEEADDSKGDDFEGDTKGDFEVYDPKANNRGNLI